MSAAFYFTVAIGLIALWRRFVHPVSLPAAAALVLVPLLFTGSALLRGRVYAPVDLPYATEPLLDYRTDAGLGEKPYNATLSDLYMQMVPWQSAVRQSYARGEWPLWNPHLLGGTVLAANMQSAPYDPLQLVGMLLPHPDALTFGASLTFFLALLTAFTFARSLGCGEVAALTGASGYAFCGMLAFFVQWPLGRIWAWFPLVLYAVRLVVREPGRRGTILLTAVFSVILLTGHPESVLHMVTCGAAWGAFELFGIDRNGRLAAIGRATLAGVLALLLTAFALLPFFEAAHQTSDYFGRKTLFAPKNLDIPVEAVTRRALASAFPFVHSSDGWNPPAKHWEPTTLRVGGIVLSLAVAGVVLARRRRETRFFAGLALLAGLAGLNAWPVAELLHDIPPFDIAINERLIFAAAFALSVLAALGIQEMATVPSQRRAGAAVLLLVSVGLALGSALLYAGQIAGGAPERFVANRIAVELVPFAILIPLVLFATKRWLVLASALALVLAQRTIEDGRIYPAIEKRAFYPELPVLQHIQKDRSGPFRIVAPHYGLVPATAAMYGLEDVRGYEAMTNLRLLLTYDLWCAHQPLSFNIVRDWSRPFLSFLNVKYAVARAAYQPDEQWKLVFEDRNSRVFENTRVLPRAFVPHWIEYVQKYGQAMRVLRGVQDFSEVATIEARELVPHRVASGPGTVEVKPLATGEMRLRVRMESDGWVVISEPAWSGWRTYLDGRRVRPHFANHAFLGVFVPRGEHELHVRFLPESVTNGRRISLATAAALGLWALAQHFKRKRSASFA
jgi:hypothetical protein